MDNSVKAGDGTVYSMKDYALNKTPYPLTVLSRMRKYGPPSGWFGPKPGPDREVYCGSIPKDFYEDKLIPLFETCGAIWDLRLMMDTHTSQSRGYCFITYMEEQAVQLAVKQLDGYTIDGSSRLKVRSLPANHRLFLSGVPKSRSRVEIMNELVKVTGGLMDVIVCAIPGDQRKNRGFAFLEYLCHKSASDAKKRLEDGHIRIFDCCISVDWADPLEPPDEESMSKVKVLVVRNLKADVTEEQLREKFEWYGGLEKVEKYQDHGFVHFYQRQNAVKALEELHGTRINGCELLISLAKPPNDNKTRERRHLGQAVMVDRHDPYSSGGVGLSPSCLLPSAPQARTLEPTIASHTTLGGYAYGGCDPSYYIQCASYSSPIFPTVHQTRRNHAEGLPGMTTVHRHETRFLRPSVCSSGMAFAGRGSLVIRPVCAPYEHGMELACSREAVASSGVKRKTSRFSQVETKKPLTQKPTDTEIIVHQMATCSVTERHQDPGFPLDEQELG